MESRQDNPVDNNHPLKSLFEIMAEIERQLIIDMLAQTGTQTEAATRFQIPLSTLNQKIKRLGIDAKKQKMVFTLQK